MHQSTILLPLLCAFSLSKAAEVWTSGFTPTSIVNSDVHDDCTLWVNGIQSAKECLNMLDSFNITQDEFTAWNPSVGKDCWGLNPSHSYCVEAPMLATRGDSAYQEGFPSNCNLSYYVEKRDNCSSIETECGISHDLFIALNPAVKNDCSNLLAGYRVCITLPNETRYHPGTDGDCTRYDFVKNGKNCDTITKENNISPDDFHTMNPGVGSDCSKLWQGYYVCTKTE